MKSSFSVSYYKTKLALEIKYISELYELKIKS